jgi:hypothetical protein
MRSLLFYPRPDRQVRELLNYQGSTLNTTARSSHPASALAICNFKEQHMGDESTFVGKKGQMFAHKHNLALSEERLSGAKA